MNTIERAHARFEANPPRRIAYKLESFARARNRAREEALKKTRPREVLVSPSEDQALSAMHRMGEAEWTRRLYQLGPAKHDNAWRNLVRDVLGGIAAVEDVPDGPLRLSLELRGTAADWVRAWITANEPPAGMEGDRDDDDDDQAGEEWKMGVTA